MKQSFSSWATGLPKRGSRAALVVVLLGAILTLGAFSFTPSAHAAAFAGPGIAKTARIEIRTHEALSVQVREVSNPLPMGHCYNTPSHTVTITGLKGEVEFIGYTHSNCSGAVLCQVFADVPPSGNLIISLC
jgi:hypothetical protein